MFNFYIIFFLESLFTKNFLRHFSFFNDQKIEGIGDLGKYQKVSTIYVNVLRKKTYEVLTDCKDEKEKEKLRIKLFGFILYYYYEYIKN